MDLHQHLRDQADQLEQERDIARQQAIDSAEERAREGIAAKVVELLGDWEVPRVEAVEMVRRASYTFEHHRGMVTAASVHLDTVTFRAYGDQSAARSEWRWAEPRLAVAKFCPACGAWAPVLTRNVEDPPEVVKALAGPIPEHSTGVEVDDRAERCDGTRAWLPEPPVKKPRYWIGTARPYDSWQKLLDQAEAEGYMPRQMVADTDGLVIMFELAPEGYDAEEPF